MNAHSCYRTHTLRSALTIGYGDLVPSNTWAKILVFPFSILTISQLANEIYIIFGFIGKRAQERRERWRRRYEGAMHAEANRRRPKAGLLEEMALIDHINKREELYVGAVSPIRTQVIFFPVGHRRLAAVQTLSGRQLQQLRQLLTHTASTSQLYDLVWSMISLIAFWVVGAAMFSSIEGWSYGNAIYAVVILSLTIGESNSSRLVPVQVYVPSVRRSAVADRRDRFRRLCAHRSGREDRLDSVRALVCADRHVICRANHHGFSECGFECGFGLPPATQLLATSSLRHSTSCRGSLRHLSSRGTPQRQPPLMRAAHD